MLTDDHSSPLDMSVEGVFRKNGNIRRLKDLSELIDKDPSSVNLSEDNPVQVAALLKKFLRDLPDPLLTFKLHRLFVVSQSKLIRFWSTLESITPNLVSPCRGSYLTHHFLLSRSRF